MPFGDGSHLLYIRRGPSAPFAVRWTATGLRPTYGEWGYRAMRIALFADIHGNLPAFEAALKHAATLSPDLTVVCGDVVNGCPDSRGCWDLAQSLGCPLLRGN